jgi:hypothetical protein
MKKSILLSVCILIAVVLNAQKLTVKSGKILKDNIPVGKVEGEVGMIKSANLKFYGTDNNLIMSLEEKSFSLNNPLYSDYYYYIIKFEDSGKEMMYKISAHCPGEKCIVKKLADEAEFDFNGKAIPNQDEIIGKYDYTNAFITDTTEKRNQEALISQWLTENEILRDKSKDIVLMPQKTETFAYTTKTWYQVAQDNVVIGTALKEYTSSPSVSTIYWISEKFYSPKGTNGDINETFAAKATTSLNSLSVFTFAYKKWHTVNVKDVNYAEKELIKYLINNKYL